jgi:putative peptidoglycan lipid II flippase
MGQPPTPLPSTPLPSLGEPPPPTLFRAFATVGGYTMLSRLTGLLRETLMSRFLGAGAVSDAFFIAFQFPNLFRSLFAEGAFSSSFVPIFSQTLERDGKAKAKVFADQAFAVLTLVLILFCVVVVYFMPQVLSVLAAGFDKIPGQLERTTDLARVMFPYLLFISLTSLQSGVLNALGRFAVPAAAPVLLNIVFIVALLIGVGAGGNRAMFLAWGVLVSGVVQLVWLALDCRRVGMRFTLVRPRLTPDVKTLLLRILPMAFGAGIYQFNVMANKSIATLLGVGAVSWITFADRVNLLPVAIFGTAVGVALLPLLARHIQAGNEQAALHEQNRAIEISLLLTVPAAAGIAMLAGPITSTLFEGGMFTPHDRQMVAMALLAFSTGIPAYVLNKALTPGFFGRHDTKTPVIASSVALVINIALNIALMKPLGHVGIALGTSVSAWVNAGILTMILHRRGYLQVDERLKSRLPRIVAASAVMTAVLWGGLLAMDRFLGPVYGADDTAAGPFGLRVLVLAALIGAGGAAYGLAALLFGAARRSDLAALRRGPKGTLPPAVG